MDESNNGTQLNTPPAAGGTGNLGIDWQKVGLRVKEVMTNPRGIWPIVKAEETAIDDLFKNYVLILAAVPALCLFLNTVVLGISLPLAGTYRWPLFTGLVIAVLTYVVQVATVFLSGLVVQKLGSYFGAAVRPVDAMKLVAYAMTPAMVGSVLTLLPGVLSGLSILFVIYGLYLLYLGLPEMTGVGRDSNLTYFIASLVCIIIVSAVLNIVIAGLSPVPDMPQPPAPTTLRLPGDVEVDPAELQKGLDQIQASVKQLEKAVK